MPVRKVKGGYKVTNVPTVHKTKAEAEAQYRAILAARAAARKKKK